MCHQTVCLIARLAESAGIPTLSMSSARDITEAGRAPRATFLDWPLGHTSGRPDAPALDAAVMRATLAAFDSIDRPDTIVDLPFPWADDDDWKDRVMRPRPKSSAGAARAADDRVARRATPQYQTPADADAAERSHDGADCAVCAGIDY